MKETVIVADVDLSAFERGCEEVINQGYSPIPGCLSVSVSNNEYVSEERYVAFFKRNPSVSPEKPTNTPVKMSGIQPERTE